MFVISLKSTRAKIALLVSFVVLFAVGAAVWVSTHDGKQTAEETKQVRAGTNEERLAFLAQFGWEAQQEPVEVKEIQIPASFDEVYSRYNELQKRQGFDLSAYCGKTAKSWSYRILNYPGYEDKDLIRGNLLVLNDTVIGGDISSVELDGFMKPFEPESESTSVFEDPLLHLGE